jgi:hypothetical protein
MNKNYHKILKTNTGLTYNLPLFLEADLDEMGVMVGFDGDIEQVKKNIEADIEEVVSEIERLETETETNFKKIKEVYNEIFEL